MKIGVFLHDHFYRKHCGRPMFGLEENGWFVLDIKEACRVTPVILEDLKNQGAECIEMGGSLDRLEKMVPALKSRPGLEMILHTEGDPSLNKCESGNPNTSAAAIANLKRNVDTARKISARAIVIHPPPYRASSAETMAECVDYAREGGVRLYIENCGYGREGIEEVKRFLGAPGLEELGCVFDSGHANIGAGASGCAVMLGGKIDHVHWHDNDGKKDRHMGPGMGTLDSVSLMKTLLDIESRTKKEITLTLECDKPAVDYEDTLRKTILLRNNLLIKNG